MIDHPIEDYYCAADAARLTDALDKRDIPAIELILREYCHEGVRLEPDGTVGICSFDVPGDDGEDQLVWHVYSGSVRDWPEILQNRLIEVAKHVLSELQRGVGGC